MVDPASDYPDGCPECGCRVHVDIERPWWAKRAQWVARCVFEDCGWCEVEGDEPTEPDVEDGPDQDGGGA